MQLMHVGYERCEDLFGRYEGFMSAEALNSVRISITYVVSLHA